MIVFLKRRIFKCFLAVLIKIQYLADSGKHNFVIITAALISCDYF